MYILFYDTQMESCNYIALQYSMSNQCLFNSPAQRVLARAINSENTLKGF